MNETKDFTAPLRVAVKIGLEQCQEARCDGADYDTTVDIYGPSLLEDLVKAMATIDVLMAALGKHIEMSAPGRDGCQCVACESRKLYQDLK